MYIAAKCMLFGAESSERAHAVDASSRSKVPMNALRQNDAASQ